jgi:hypothetical protein
MSQVREERRPRSCRLLLLAAVSSLALTGCVRRAPHLDVSTKEIDLGTDRSSASFTVRNSARDLLFTSGVTPLDYDIHTDVDWLTVTPASGSCGEDEKKTHVVNVDRGSAGDGDQLGLVLITSNGGDATLQIHFVNGGGPAPCTARPSAACSPSPPDGKNDVNENSDLAWSCGETACGLSVTYDVYFGTAPTPGDLVGSAGARAWSLSTLAKNTTYYWQVVARDANGSTRGPVWSFKTRR